MDELQLYFYDCIPNTKTLISQLLLNGFGKLFFTYYLAFLLLTVKKSSFWTAVALEFSTKKDKKISDFDNIYRRKSLFSITVLIA